MKTKNEGICIEFQQAISNDIEIPNNLETVHNILEKTIEAGNLDEMNELIKLIPENKLIEVLYGDYHRLFRFAGEKGSLSIVNRFIELTTDKAKLDEMIHAVDDECFMSAVKFDNLSIMKLLRSHTKDTTQLKNMIRTMDDYPFRTAVENDNLESVDMMFEIITEKEERHEMIHGLDDYAFRKATNLPMIQKLMEYTPNIEDRYAMICSRDYEALKNFIEKDKFNILEEVIVKILPTSLEQLYNDLSSIVEFKNRFENLNSFENHINQINAEQDIVNRDNNDIGYVGRLGQEEKTYISR